MLASSPRRSEGREADIASRAVRVASVTSAGENMSREDRAVRRRLGCGLEAAR